MSRYFLKLSYKGTNFHGWQTQDNALSVQEELNTALGHLISGEIVTTGCGRTDTGVHARMFYAHFDSDKIVNKEQFLYRINRIVSRDIAVSQLIDVRDNAHARFDAVERTYKYYIHRVKDPFLEGLSLYHFGELDFDAMNKAAERIVGKKDFSCFSKSNTQVKTNDCDVKVCRLDYDDKHAVLTITADRFLRNMVRSVMGTLILIGKGELQPGDMDKIIEDKSRGNAGPSVAAHGLFLENIIYPKEIFLI